MLGGYDLPALGAGSAAYYELMARALARVFRDRARFMADPMATDLPTTMANRQYAAELRARIDEERAVTPLPGTTQVSALDADGSAVSFTHSVGTGSGVVTPGLGFMLNNNMMAFDPRKGRGNSIAPGQTHITTSRSPKTGAKRWTREVFVAVKPECAHTLSSGGSDGIRTHVSALRGR